MVGGKRGRATAANERVAQCSRVALRERGINIPVNLSALGRVHILGPIDTVGFLGSVSQSWSEGSEMDSALLQCLGKGKSRGLSVGDYDSPYTMVKGARSPEQVVLRAGIPGYTINSQIGLIILLAGRKMFLIGFLAISGLLGELIVKGIVNTCSIPPTGKRLH